jgi:hypothetical protein
VQRSNREFFFTKAKSPSSDYGRSAGFWWSWCWWRLSADSAGVAKELEALQAEKMNFEKEKKRKLQYRVEHVDQR